VEKIMAKQNKIYIAKKRKKRGSKLRPLNMRKRLGPKSGWKNMKKRKRGQGGS
jgi:hypothetical protein|tara:strand:+ start:300 stop:458 length:159 start_codon:yes stop_codon:yes gene_type:complete